ncbi:MAG: hypothetical protein KKF89_00520, partial [Nanoarchaeota archaeon]|nr:hypothetical protein [Nanoarchaeota archaeon]
MVFDFGSDSSIIVSIRSDIKNLQSGLNKANSEIKKFSNETDKGLKKTGVAGLNLGSILSTSLGFGIAQLASTGVRQIKQFVTESIGDFLNFEQALISFELVVGETSDSLINNLKKASGETISTLNLVSSANKALALGISKDQLPELMATATARAKIMGITATQAFNDIATGIGRQSRMILDNLGIILDLDKAYNEYAESLGRTAESLSEYEKKTAIANSVIKETSALVEVMGFTAESHKTKIERLTAAWEDFKISLGEGIVTIYDLSFGFKEFNSVLDDLPDDIQGKVKGWTTEYLDLNRALEASTSSLKILESEIRGFGSTPLEGETEKDLVIAEKKGELTKAELALENKKKEVRESGYTGDIDIMWSKEEENIKSITEELRIL